MNNSTHSPAGRRRKSSRTRSIVVAAVVVLAGATWYGVHTYRANAAKAGEYLFSTVEFGNVEDLVSATGTLEPLTSVDVGAQVSGQIERIYVEVGDVVKAGDVLAKIDATTSEAKVEANQARLESSKISLATQRSNLEKAQRDFERQKNLLVADATTRESYLNAQTSLENAERSVRSSELSIQQQEAEMRIEENNLKFTQIIAPIDGTVMSIAVKEGQTINASQNAPTVMKLADLNTMTVRSDVSEADVARLSVGMDVYFTTLGAGQNRRWYATVKRIEPTPKVQNSVVLFPVLFDIENEGNSLKPNMTTQVFFVVAESRNVLTVPMAALQQGQQIARELAAKRQEEEMVATTRGAPEGAPGAAGTPAEAPAAGGSVPAATADAAARQGGQDPGGGEGARGGFGGQRGGGMGGFNPENMTAEQREEMTRRFQQGGGGLGGRQGGGGFGGRQGGGGMASAGGGRQQQRRGTVIVRLADGTLEPRPVVVGVTDRIYGQVIEGLEEGEEVIVGKVEPEAAVTPSTQNQQNQNQNFDPRRGGNNFGGGGFGGGGGRPF